MRRLLNDQWRFARLPLGSDLSAANQADFAPVCLPHDWLIADTDNLYAPGDGWYRRTLTADELAGAAQALIRFEGVYMDSEVYWNGAQVAAHPYGYTPFEVALTPEPGQGGELMVHVRHASPNSRWYSGAGIERDVWLITHAGAGLVTDGLYITPAPAAEGWTVRASAELTARTPDGTPVTFRLTAPDGQVAAEAVSLAEAGMARAELPVKAPLLWSVETPHLYRLAVLAGEDRLESHVGLRTVELNPDTGFWLNGQRLKLQGVCLHHDLGALGAAFHPKAAERQLRLMKAMGVNALRTSHNPPAPQVLDLCDSMGILVCDEAFDMWLRAKTPYDYARFFADHAEADVAAMVRRDRNHPCVVMFSVGNEIYDTLVDASAVEVTRRLKAAVEANDPDHHAPATIGSNYMPWEGAQRCADVLKVAGYNYAEKYYDQHHREHPDWVIYGSETASILQSRGVYHFPLSSPILADEDEQCSVLGNSHNSWGAHDLRAMLAEEAERPYSLGQFIWAGIDYIGEPTPYHTRSSYFGQVDTAGFVKDSYYLYQAAWSQKPMVWIGVSWNWNPGQMIDIPVYTNAAQVTLYLNGVSLGTQRVERWRALWQVPYAPGVLRAVACDDEGREVASAERFSHGDTASLCLAAEEEVLRADGRDLTFVTVTALDADGHLVENAIDRVHAEVEGAFLLGMDNGDSTDHDGYQTDSRRLFAGRLLLLVGAATQPGTVRVTVSAPGVASATLTLKAVAAEALPGTEPLHTGLRLQHPAGEDIAARQLILTPTDSGLPVCLSPETPSAHFTVETLPASAAPQQIFFRVVTAAGIDSPCATLTPTADGVTVTGRGDGDIYLRATVRNGDTHARVISQLELHLTGFGQPCLDPYQLITGGLYDLHEGEIGVGNELGVAFARDGESMVGFSHVDFGAAGSDEITIPIFALNDEDYAIDVWRGDPRCGGERVATLHYQKPSRWNTYQAETWRLPVRFRGLETICFSMDRKVHMKGFTFTRQSRAWQRLTAAEADSIYGDQFRVAGSAVRDIGNNVTLTFEQMDFEEGGAVSLRLTGFTPLATNGVNVRFTDASGAQTTQMCPFRHTDGVSEQAFSLTAPAGLCTVDFVFLPGCQFDFEAAEFRRV